MATRVDDPSRTSESDDEQGLLNGERGWRSREKRERGMSWVVAVMFFAFGLLVGVVGGMEWRKHDAENGYREVVAQGGFEADKEVVFEMNETFERKMGKLSDALWEGLMPKGHGFIQVDDKNRAIPHTDKEGDLSQTKVVSVFHQLHCLNTIRQSLNTAIDLDPNFNYLALQFAHHWAYCFDYLRQSLMCTADLTLENLIKREGSLSEEVDGWGTKHMCRDWEKVFEWAEGHRVGKGLGIE
ncbi:hypothetical protein P154DRAFT_616893 [Amniculicola lignicola CBS 123094]|uniref:Uncharacterized protein n=1 Tax=Amniculicola lignicola CBS 123094 TaxID=1392246 RepID=A0A6A5X096_9PLEO|nr:hypothetical protein P154DRAFT_616893 [Amniculicola lignicola CBS 123094]